MAQITNRSTLSTVLTTALDDTFTNRGKTLKKVWPSFLKTKKLEKGQWIDYDRANFGLLAKKGEQDTIVYDQLEWGNSFQVNVDSFALAFRISREALSDLAGGGYGVDTDKIATLGAITESFRDAVQATEEDLAAQLLLNFTSTTVSAKWIGGGRDAVALAGTHTLLKNGVGTYGNAMTAASLNYYQLQSGISLLETIPTDEGFYTPIPGKVILVVGPYNRHRAYELVKSTKKPDGNENNPSSLNDFDIEIVVDPYVGSTYKGFAIMDPNRHRCYFLDREGPTFDKEGDFETAGGMKYSTFRRCKVTFSSGHGFVGNAGA